MSGALDPMSRGMAPLRYGAVGGVELLACGRRRGDGAAVVAARLVVHEPRGTPEPWMIRWPHIRVQLLHCSYG